MKYPLDGKTVVVTGGGRGYGKHMAEALAREGARLVVASRTIAEAETVAAGIVGAGGQAFAVRADVTSEADAAELMRSAERRFGQIDVLINNAGHPGKVGALELPPSEWDAPFRVNVMGSLICSQAALPYMRRQRSGHIVNLSSLTARASYGSFRSMPYTVSKYAVDGLTITMAAKLRDDGIRVNAFVPGLAHTRFLDDVPEGHWKGRTCQRVEHVEEPIVYLLSEDVPTGELFNALAWLEERGKLAGYTYVHD